MRTDHANHTITVMLAGIPNVGKSALANALHQIGRISAAGTSTLGNPVIWLYFVDSILISKNCFSLLFPPK